MAGADRMTIEEVVGQVLLDEHADVIGEAVKVVAAELMELEVCELVGAECGERRPADRATHRNGYDAIPAQLGTPRQGHPSARISGEAEARRP